jgi:protein-S-isoprenylcysteine O-methyltransferase Ste14
MLSYVRGRVARPASPGWNVLKTLLQMVVFWCLFLFLLPWAITALEHATGLDGWRFGCPAGQWGGGLLFALGGSLGLTSAVVMAARGRGTPLPADCARELVVVGPYRYVRNPMAVAGLAQGVAVGVFLGSPGVIAYALVGGPIWHLLVRPWEEADLAERFGEAYRRYRAAVRCWVPRFSGYRASSGAVAPTADDA